MAETQIDRMLIMNDNEECWLYTDFINRNRSMITLVVAVALGVVLGFGIFNVRRRCAMDHLNTKSCDLRGT